MLCRRGEQKGVPRSKIFEWKNLLFFKKTFSILKWNIIKVIWYFKKCYYVKNRVQKTHQTQIWATCLFLGIERIGLKISGLKAQYLGRSWVALNTCPFLVTRRLVECHWQESQFHETGWRWLALSSCFFCCQSQSKF